jgi:acetyl esterase
LDAEEATLSIDPQLEPLLELLAQTPLPPEHGIDEFRAFASVAHLPVTVELPEVTDRTIPGPAGEIAVRLYRPTTDDDLPVIVFFHGGGFVAGSLDSHDHLCRVTCAGSGAVVVAVDYRLAPEHAFPAAVDDAWAAVGWVTSHGKEIGVDASRLALMGDSAGATLAAVSAQRARDTGLPVALQVLVYPAVDAGCTRPSMSDADAAYMLTPAAMQWFNDQYLPDAETRRDPSASPFFGNLSGVAPAVVVTAEHDPLRDQGDAYADALAAAGVPTEHDRGPGMIHGFVMMDMLLDTARATQKRIVTALAAALHPTAS